MRYRTLADLYLRVSGEPGRTYKTSIAYRQQSPLIKSHHVALSVRIPPRTGPSVAAMPQVPPIQP